MNTRLTTLIILATISASVPAFAAKSVAPAPAKGAKISAPAPKTKSLKVHTAKKKVTLAPSLKKSK